VFAGSVGRQKTPPQAAMSLAHLGRPGVGAMRLQPGAGGNIKDVIGDEEQINRDYQIRKPTKKSSRRTCRAELQESWKYRRRRAHTSRIGRKNRT